MAKTKRVNKKGIVLRPGESVRKTGIYDFRFTDARGKRHSIYSRDLAELREREEKLLLQSMQGISYTNVTLNNWFDDFMAIYKEDKLKETTKANYYNYYKWYVRDTVGKMRINDIKRSHIMKLYKNLLDDSNGQKLSIGTVKYINNIINSTLEQAVNNDLILKNPCRNIMSEFKNEEQKTRTALTEIQQERFFYYIKSDNNFLPYLNLFIVAFGTGMRIGELLALTWNDIDRKENVISVNKTLHYKKKDNNFQYFITDPKTKNATRTIPMLQEVSKALLKQKEQQLMLGIRKDIEISGYSNFVFTTATGKPYGENQINHVIKRICNNINKTAAADNKQNEMPYFTAHVMRHTFCSRMCEHDVDIKSIQMIMGHGDIKTTMDIYTHISEQKKQKAILKLENIKIS